MALSKSDQIRALRERHYAEQQAPAKPALPVTNVTNSVTNASRPAKPNDNARVLRWRTNNPDRYRAYMRDYMAKRRAAAKETNPNGR